MIRLSIATLNIRLVRMSNLAQNCTSNEITTVLFVDSKMSQTKYWMLASYRGQSASKWLRLAKEHILITSSF